MISLRRIILRVDFEFASVLKKTAVCMYASLFPSGVTSTVPVVEGVHTLGRKGTSISFPDDRCVAFFFGMR